MVIRVFENYTIEIFSDQQFELDSCDNVTSYNHVYNNYTRINMDYDKFAPKYGICLKEDDTIIRSAIIISGGGGCTSPSEKSVLVDHGNLIVIIDDSVFSLALPDLLLNWKVSSEECVTCFELYQFDRGYLIHGEVSIFKLSLLGNIEWEFTGRDIFTTIEGVDDFLVYDNYIIAKDWEENIYKLDTNGKQIS